MADSRTSHKAAAFCVRLTYESADLSGDVWLHRCSPDTVVKTDAELEGDTIPLLGQEAVFVESERLGFLCADCMAEVAP